MKTSRLRLILAVTLAGISAGASAQYYAAANQVANVLQNALQGGFNYKGFVDASYTIGLGNLSADFVGVSTVQGFRYADWFFMGAGIGVDVVFSHPKDNWNQGWADRWTPPSTNKTGVMIPLFTDFRFNIGGMTSPSFFIDLKLGCSFLCGDRLRIGYGYLTNQEYFYMKPTLGLRVPVNSENPKQAFNIGVTYQMLAADYWSGYSGNRVLSALGGTISYEW